MKKLLVVIMAVLLAGVAVRPAAATDTLVHFDPRNLPFTPTAPVANFTWVVPGGALPTEEQCAQEIAYTPETIPSNVQMNKVVPTAGELSTFNANPVGLNTGIVPTADYTNVSANHVTGDYPTLIGVTPSTDMLIRWMSCKWGLDEETMRAESWQESTWREDELGDVVIGAAGCEPSGLPAPAMFDVNINFTNGTQRREPGGCWTSYGILQDKVTGYTTVYPTLMHSTAFAMDFRGASVRACINGDQNSWFTSQGSCTTPLNGHETCTAALASPSSTVAADNGVGSDLYDGCIATHFSGNWWGSGADGYWTSITGLMTSKPWPGGR